MKLSRRSIDVVDIAEQVGKELGIPPHLARIFYTGYLATVVDLMQERMDFVNLVHIGKFKYGVSNNKGWETSTKSRFKGTPRIPKTIL